MKIAPRQESGAGGCFGKGCLLFVALAFLLVIAFAGGTFWAMKRLQNTYSTTTPTTFPELTTGSQEGDAQELEADAGEPTGGEAFDKTDQTPQRGSAAPSVAALQRRWRAFEKAADRHQKARIQLTDQEINTLLQNDPKLRGKAQVSVQENVGHVKVSIPMSDLLGGNSGSWAGTLFGVEGRYFNGAATVRPSPDGDPAKAQISNVQVAGQTVPETFLDQRFFGLPSVRGLISDWLQDQEIERFEIRNDEVIAETRGR